MIFNTIVTNIVVVIINFITSMLAARLLGAEGRGELAIILLYPQLIATMGMLGVDRSLSLLGGKGITKPSLKFIMVLSTLFSIPIVTAIFYVVEAKIENSDLVELSLLYSAYVPALYVFMFSSAFFNGAGMFKQFNISKLSFYLSYALVLIILGQLLDDILQVFLYSNLASAYVAALVSLFFLIKEDEKGPVDNIFKNITLTLKKARYYIIPGVLIILSSKIDLIMASDFFSIELLGVFVVYLAYAHLLGPLEMAVNTHMLHYGIIYSEKSAMFTIRVTLFVFISGSALLALISPFAVGLLYGDEYLVEIHALQILSFSSFFYFSFKNMNEYMIGRSLVNQDSISSVIFIVTFAIFAYILIFWYQFTGLILAVLLANMVRFLYIIKVFRNRMKVSFSEFLIVNRKDVVRIMENIKSLK